MFDRLSTNYDRTNRFLSFGLDLRWRRSLADYLPDAASLNVLDLATGTGDQIVSLIQKNAPINKAIGIDLSEKMLKIAEKKFVFSPPPFSVEFQKADAEDLPFCDNSFDLCTFSFGIRNVQHPFRALSEMLRVTQSKGRCLILEFSMPRDWRLSFYRFYLRWILPLIGRLLTKDLSAYRYLYQSIERFPPQREFLAWMRQAGWKNVHAVNLFCGIVILFHGDKE